VSKLSAEKKKKTESKYNDIYIFNHFPKNQGDPMNIKEVTAFKFFVALVRGHNTTVIFHFQNSTIFT